MVATTIVEITAAFFFDFQPTSKHDGHSCRVMLLQFPT